jgi:hypothetical protein
MDFIFIHTMVEMVNCFDIKKGPFMAFGILCKHCGWQESEHDDKGLVLAKERETVFSGKSRSLAKCRKFVGEKRLTTKERKDLIEGREEEDLYDE